jgi:hypothetical protein
MPFHHLPGNDRGYLLWALFLPKGRHRTTGTDILRPWKEEDKKTEYGKCQHPFPDLAPTIDQEDIFVCMQVKLLELILHLSIDEINMHKFCVSD